MRSLGTGIHARSVALQLPERQELKLLVSMSSKRSVATTVIAPHCRPLALRLLEEDELGVLDADPVCKRGVAPGPASLPASLGEAVGCHEARAAHGASGRRRATCSPEQAVGPSRTNVATINNSPG